MFINLMKEIKIRIGEPKDKNNFEELKRYYKKFKDINEGLILNEPSEFYVDTIYSFFIHCFHLKDWIKKGEFLLGEPQQLLPTTVSDNKE